MSLEKEINFEKFAKKAAEKIEERKKRRKKILYSKELDEKIEIRGLTTEEFLDASEYSENKNEVDKYTIYYASETLQDLASYMVKEGIIKEHLEVMNMFSITDISKLANEIIELSGLNDESSISEVSELKN